MKQGNVILSTGTVLRDRYQIVQCLGGGGQGQTYEVDDQGIPKVLKILHENYPTAIRLFQREAKVLSQLRHPGIPRVDKDGYFTLQLHTHPDPLHCLVMEKIPGIDLRQWLMLSEHSLSQEQAIAWLQQLVKILSQIHHQQCFHRDIKPSNIMLKPNGQLVLIDFGAVRDITETYLRKQQQDFTGTQPHSGGYTPLEQIQGRAVLQSDFYALGRTFVHLLTKQHPSQFAVDAQTGQLLWHSSAPQICPNFAALIDHLMAPFPGQRPQTAAAILQALAALTAQERLEPPDADTLSVADLSRTQPDPVTATDITVAPDQLITQGTITPSSRHRSSPIIRKCLMIVTTSVITTAIVMAARLQGWLQHWELPVYDQMMRSRPSESTPDQRLLVITIDDADIAYQQQQGWSRRWSLSDEALERLLIKLERFQPRAIGLDIIRSAGTDANQPRLAQLLANHDRLYAVCQVQVPGDRHPGTLSPPEIPVKRQGFTNIVIDPDGVVRRHLLFMDRFASSPCQARAALSTQLATRYLQDIGITKQFTSAINLQLGPVVFKRLRVTEGGYQPPPGGMFGGSQIMLNYRSYRHSPFNVADTITLTDILTDNISPEQFKDRVILIGVVTTAVLGDSDRFFTPYSRGRSPDQAIPGVFLHAQMVSQIINAVLDQRVLISVLPCWQEIFWLFSWCLLGSLIGLGRSRVVAIATGSILISLYGICYVVFVQGFWIPCIPAGLGLLITGGSTAVYCGRYDQRMKSNEEGCR
jgi:CHASE2 domain-containing sensor protein/serine/threonine protein kinase